jgi:hypothetical protein
LVILLVAERERAHVILTGNAFHVIINEDFDDAIRVWGWF